MKLRSLQDLFVKELKDVYSAEQQLVKALPKMAKAASAPEVQKAFNEHLDQTRRQVERLQKVFQSVDVAPRALHCKGMEGLIDETNELFQDGEESSSTLDAALISAAQKAEHYEMAVYGSMRTFAERLGNQQAARLLKETLEEEKQTDRKLSEIAENVVNPKAQQGEDGGSQLESQGRSRSSQGNGHGQHSRPSNGQSRGVRAQASNRSQGTQSRSTPSGSRPASNQKSQRGRAQSRSRRTRKEDSE